MFILALMSAVPTETVDNGNGTKTFGFTQKECHGDDMIYAVI